MAIQIGGRSEQYLTKPVLQRCVTRRECDFICFKQRQSIVNHSILYEYVRVWVGRDLVAMYYALSHLVQHPIQHHAWPWCCTRARQTTERTMPNDRCGYGSSIQTVLFIHRLIVTWNRSIHYIKASKAAPAVPPIRSILLLRSAA